MQHAARPPRSPGSCWAPHRAALAILSALLLTPALAAQTLPQLPGTVQEPSSAEAAPMPSATERMASLSTELETARARLGNANEEAAAILMDLFSPGDPKSTASEENRS